MKKITFYLTLSFLLGGTCLFSGKGISAARREEGYEKLTFEELTNTNLEKKDFIINYGSDGLGRLLKFLGAGALGTLFGFGIHKKGDISTKGAILKTIFKRETLIPENHRPKFIAFCSIMVFLCAYVALLQLFFTERIRFSSDSISLPISSKDRSRLRKILYSITYIFRKKSVEIACDNIRLYTIKNVLKEVETGKKIKVDQGINAKGNLPTNVGVEGQKSTKEDTFHITVSIYTRDYGNFTIKLDQCQNNEDTQLDSCLAKYIFKRFFKDRNIKPTSQSNF